MLTAIHLLRKLSGEDSDTPFTLPEQQGMSRIGKMRSAARILVITTGPTTRVSVAIALLTLAAGIRSRMR